MFQGSMVAIVTPMKVDGTIDYPRYADLIEFHIENGTHALVPAGTTGESATLDFDEHCEVIRFAVEQVAKRIPVIAGTGANSTREALALTQCAKQHGADACLLVTPYYNKPPQEGLYQHYKLIAESVAIPQILYNVPARTAVDMQVDTVERLSHVENIIGIKEATGTPDRALEIMRRCDKSFDVYSGEDIAAAEMMLGGGDGVISVTANVAPQKMAQMCEAALKKDTETTHKLDSELLGLHQQLFIESNPIPSKWALKEMGLIGEGIRLPLVPLAKECHAAVREAMQQAGVIT